MVGYVKYARGLLSGRLVCSELKPDELVDRLSPEEGMSVVND